MGLDRGDGFRNLSTVGPAPVCGRSGSHELTLILQYHRPTSSPCAGACFLGYSASERASSTSPAQAARPELLEGGLLAPQPMDYFLVSPVFPFFSSLTHGSKCLKIGRMVLQARSQGQNVVIFLGHGSPRKKPQLSTPSLAYQSSSFHSRGVWALLGTYIHSMLSLYQQPNYPLLDQIQLNSTSAPSLPRFHS